jgi:hypothetical protein
MPERALIPHASRGGLRLALALASLTLPLLVGSARARGADPPQIPEGQAAVAAPPAPLVVAADPAPPPTPPAVAIAPPPAVVDTAPAPERVSVLLPRADGGVAVVPGRRVGGYGSAALDALWNADRRRLKPVWGLSGGWEFFGSPGTRGGGGFNIGLLGGLRSPTVFALVGAGVNAFTFDLEKGGGGGILSPRASARVGFVVGSFHLGAIAQVQRRWQWGSEDLTLVTLGLALGGMWEERDDR